MKLLGRESARKTIDLALQEVEKQFGKGAVMLLGGDGPTAPVATHPTGSVGLDRALGGGGLPQGRIVEIYGPEASGKTSLALHALAEVQAKGGHAAFIDAEHALDPRYASALGVDLKRLLIAQPDCGEQALEITETLVRSGAVSLIVVDSVAALVPRAELEGEMGDAHMGLQARLMSQAMRKLTGHTARTGTTIIFINQTRQKIGVVFGSPEVTTGGNALKFYASIRIDVRRVATIKHGDEAIGNRVRAKVVKNKLAPPFREAEFEIVYGQGISTAGEVLDLGVDGGQIQRSGTWYSIGEERIGQGRENARKWLDAHPDRRAALADVLRGNSREAEADEENKASTAPAPTETVAEAKTKTKTDARRGTSPKKRAA